MPGPTLSEVENESAADTMRGVLAELTAEPSIDPVTAPDEPVVEERRVERKPEPTSIDSRMGGRDPKGRFTPKSKDETRDEPAVAAKVIEPVTEPIDEPALEPPHEWTAEEQDTFRALPAPAQKMVMDRATQAAEATRQATTIQQRLSAVEQILTPRRGSFARDGLDDAGALRQLFALSDEAARDPSGFIRWFVQARGLDPNQVFGGGGGQQPEQLDPAIAPVVQRLTQTEQLLQQMVQRSQQADQQRAQQEENQVKSELQNFIEAKDAKGRPQAPYYNEVRSLMGQFIGSGTAPDLKTAYDMACRAHPAVYAKVQSAAKAEQTALQAKAQREKAAAAKQAGSSVTGTPGDRARPEPTGDIREQMRQEFAARGLMP